MGRDGPCAACGNCWAWICCCIAKQTKQKALGVALLLTCTGKDTVQNWAGAQTIPAEARFEAPIKVRASSGSTNPRRYLFWDCLTLKMKAPPNKTAPYATGNRTSSWLQFLVNSGEVWNITSNSATTTSFHFPFVKYGCVCVCVLVMGTSTLRLP